jgi:tetratricopeptide (TPR) repeat protein
VLDCLCLFIQLYLKTEYKKSRILMMMMKRFVRFVSSMTFELEEEGEGKRLLAAGKHRQAIDVLQRARDIMTAARQDDASWRLAETLAEAHEALGDHSAVSKLLLQSTENNNNESKCLCSSRDTLFRLMRALERDGRAHVALDVGNRCLDDVASAEYRVELLNESARLMAALGNRSGAVKLAEQALAVDEHARTAETDVRALITLGKLDEADAMAASSGDDALVGDVLVARACKDRAQLDVAERHLNAALAAYDRAAIGELNVRVAAALDMLADNYCAANKTLFAEGLFNRLLDIYSALYMRAERNIVVDKLAKLLDSLGQHSKARQIEHKKLTL